MGAHRGAGLLSNKRCVRTAEAGLRSGTNPRSASSPARGTCRLLQQRNPQPQPRPFLPALAAEVPGGLMGMEVEGGFRTPMKASRWPMCEWRRAAKAEVAATLRQRRQLQWASAAAGRAGRQCSMLKREPSTSRDGASTPGWASSAWCREGPAAAVLRSAVTSRHGSLVLVGWRRCAVDLSQHLLHRLQLACVAGTGPLPPACSQLFAPFGRLGRPLRRTGAPRAPPVEGRQALNPGHLSFRQHAAVP